jgi:hypothetical protein
MAAACQAVRHASEANNNGHQYGRTGQCNHLALQSTTAVYATPLSLEAPEGAIMASGGAPLGTPDVHPNRGQQQRKHLAIAVNVEQCERLGGLLG